MFGDSHKVRGKAVFTRVDWRINIFCVDDVLSQTSPELQHWSLEERCSFMLGLGEESANAKH
ncbi:hypothetical protein DsansV1_C04g0041241 [Dioscorea sansibarensis]